ISLSAAKVITRIAPSPSKSSGRRTRRMRKRGELTGSLYADRGERRPGSACRAEDADGVSNRLRRGTERLALALVQLELDDRLHAARAEPDRNADVQPVDPVL